MTTAKRRPKKSSLSNNYCVVAYDVAARRISEKESEVYQSLLTGTLVNVNAPLDEDYVAIKIVNHEGRYDISEEELWRCSKEALVHVDKTFWPYLSAVSSPHHKVSLLRDPALCRQLTDIEIGTSVDVLHPDNDARSSPAVVKFKGPIVKKGPGIYFGVELLEEGAVEGETDGCYGSQRLFTCPPGTGLVVAVNRLRLPLSLSVADKPSVRQLKDKFERMRRTPSLDSRLPPLSLTTAPNDKECERERERESEGGRLKAGDRVVHLSDDRPEAGVVTWVGYENSQLRVGVQFEEPVKGGNWERGRSVTLPAVEVVRASDLYSGVGGSKQPSASPPRLPCNASDALFADEARKKSNGSDPVKENQDLIVLTTPPPLSLNCDDGGGSSGSEGEGPPPFTTGSLVEVPVKGEPRYGVVRWIGTVPGDKRPRRVAGIEMEEEESGLSDGVFNGRRYFQCNPQRALFVGLNQCRHDSRFRDTLPPLAPRTRPEDFGGIDSPIISGVVRPREGEITGLCGKYRGIQGHHNSCYLDATLFSMFTFTSVFDSLLYRPAAASDIAQYEEVQRVLREEIVNPLREKLYVRADRVMKLRTLMEKLSSVTGLTTEEKDPEEFLTSLVAQILRAEPFLKLSSGQEAYHYQLFVEKDEALTLPTVQQLFEQSFLASDIKLKQVPSCLIIQMPRFGKSFKMYPRILPSQLLDVTDVIEDSPRQCTVCGKLAEYECKQCFDQCDVGLQSISFCSRCLETAHSHERRRSHGWRALSVPPEFAVLKDHCLIPRLYMQLFAVVCIETSHYVTFVKCGTGSDAPWCFFDSMADRKGEQNGYNIPETVACPDLPYWLSEKGAQTLHQIKDERQLPEHAKRLLCDAYMCMYQSSEVTMYR